MSNNEPFECVTWYIVSDPLKRLTPEEAKEVTPISDDVIEAALEEGKKNAESFIKNNIDIEEDSNKRYR